MRQLGLNKPKQGKKTKTKKKATRRLGLERLEDRVNPSQFLDAGGFVTPPFTTAQVEGVQVASNTKLLTFTDHARAHSLSTPLASDYTVTIVWGDGSSDSFNGGAVAPAHIVADATPTGSDGMGAFDQFDVTTTAGSHIYDELAAGSIFKVTVVDISSSVSTGPVSTVFAAAITDAVLTPGSLAVPTATEGAAFAFTTVFSFTDANLSATTADFTATVNTGDATPDSATNPTQVRVVQTSPGNFAVQLAYTYAEELAAQPFSVSVLDDGGQTTASSTGSISVSDAPLRAAAGPAFGSTEGATTGLWSWPPSRMPTRATTAATSAPRSTGATGPPPTRPACSPSTPASTR